LPLNPARTGEVRPDHSVRKAMNHIAHENRIQLGRSLASRRNIRVTEEAAVW
jgi:hypothetical protein